MKKETDKTQVAVFDFDDTLIEGSSPSWLVNRLFFEHKLNFLRLLKIGSWGLAYKWHLPQNEAWVRGQVFRAFEGQPREEVDRYLVQFYEQTIAHRFRPRADKEMQNRRDEGCEIIVVSASFEPIVIRAMQDHPFDYQISTRMRVAENGTYTSTVEGKPIEGEEKLLALTSWCDKHFGRDKWELAYAYADHHSDYPLLKKARHPYAITPNVGLKKRAKKEGWPILDWSINVPKN